MQARHPRFPTVRSQSSQHFPSHCHRFNIYKYNGVGPLAQHASDTLLEEVRPSVPTQDRSRPARLMHLHVACLVCHHLCLPRRSNGAQANPTSFLIAHRRVAGVTRPRLPLYVEVVCVCVCSRSLAGVTQELNLGWRRDMAVWWRGRWRCGQAFRRSVSRTWQLGPCLGHDECGHKHTHGLVIELLVCTTTITLRSC